MLLKETLGRVALFIIKLFEYGCLPENIMRRDNRCRRNYRETVMDKVKKKIYSNSPIPAKRDKKKFRMYFASINGEAF